MSKQSDAVKAFIEEHGLVQKDIAAKMGISPASLNNMLNGRDNIGKRRAQKLHDMFGFDVVYLLTGEGTLFIVYRARPGVPRFAISVPLRRCRFPS